MLVVLALVVVAIVVIEIVRTVSRRQATGRATEKARRMLVSAKSSLESLDSELESGLSDHVMWRCDLARERLTSAEYSVVPKRVAATTHPTQPRGKPAISRTNAECSSTCNVYDSSLPRACRRTS